MYSVSGIYNNRKLRENYSSAISDRVNMKLAEKGLTSNSKDPNDIIARKTGSGSNVEAAILEAEQSEEDQYIVSRETVTTNIEEPTTENEDKGSGISYNIISVVLVIVIIIMCLKGN